MSDWIRVPRSEWLETILKKHSPKVVDIGDQRDPYILIVCVCTDYKEARELGYSEAGKIFYPTHLHHILEKQYYARLDTGDMR